MFVLIHGMLHSFSSRKDLLLVNRDVIPPNQNKSIKLSENYTMCFYFSQHVRTHSIKTFLLSSSIEMFFFFQMFVAEPLKTQNR